MAAVNEPAENRDSAIKRLLLLQAISALGRVVELNFSIDASKFAEETEKFGDAWKPYNPRKAIAREGLSLTSLDGGLSGVPDLDSLREYNMINGTRYDESDFTTPTAAFDGLPTLRPVLEKFGPHLGRSHLIRFGRGGHFPPHRDAFGFDVSCFRVLGLCRNCGVDQFVFLIDGERVVLEQGKVYFIETRRDHSVFSFAEECTIMVLNVRINEGSVRALMESVKIR